MTRNIKIKVDAVTPELIRREGPELQLFIKYYYEWLQTTTQIDQEYRNFQDIDLVDENILEFFESEFLVGIPDNLLVDERVLIKNIKDFYLAKGSEKATRLLFRILFDEEINFYYPKVDILRTSAGKWIVEKSIKIVVSVGNVLFGVDSIVEGAISGAKARVNRVAYGRGNNNVAYTELFITNINKVFQENELVTVGGQAIGNVYSPGIVTYPGRYDGTDGFLSADKRLQDGTYYQEYSYEISSSQSKNQYSDILGNLIHPAGTRLFGKVVLQDELDVFDTIDLEFFPDAFYDIYAELPVGETLDGSYHLTKLRPVLDYPTLMNYTNRTVQTDTIAGKISIFNNANLSSFVGIPLGQFTDVPAKYMGTKYMVYGNPLFAANTSSNTSFLFNFAPGAFLTIDLSAYYKVSAIYTDDILLLETPFLAADFFNSTFFGRSSGNIIDDTYVVTNNNHTISLDYASNTFLYYQAPFEQNFVFRNYSGARNPVNVSNASSFDIPIPTGNYDLTYTYSNSSTTLVSNTAVANNNFSLPSDKKNVNITKMDFFHL